MTWRSRPLPKERKDAGACEQAGRLLALLLCSEKAYRLGRATAADLALLQKHGWLPSAPA